jgi:hypothetical protein
MDKGKARELLVVLSAILLPLSIIGGVWLALRGRTPAAPNAVADEACRAGTLQLVAGASEPLSITLWSSKDVPQVERAGAELDSKLQVYARKSDGKIRYQWRRVDGSEDRSAAQSEGLQPFAAGASVPSQVSLDNYLGISLAYRGERGVIPLLALDAVDAMPFWVANKIRELIARADKKDVEVAVLTGMNELGFADSNLVPRTGGVGGPSIKSILNQSFPYYALRDVPISSQVSALQAFSMLIVTQPGRALTDSELRLIDDYLMLGERTLIVFASAVNLGRGDKDMIATLDRRGLERLLAGYGIELSNDLLFDPGSAVEITTGVGQKVTFPTLPLAQRLAPDFPPFFRLDRVAFPGASTLVLHPERQPNAALSAVARTSNRAVSSSEQGQRLGPGFALPGNPAGERVLAASLSGKVKSAFGDRSANARVLVISSSQFPTNPFARAVNSDEPKFEMVDTDPTVKHLAQAYAQRHLTDTILVVKSALDWATADERIIACSALLVKAPAAQTKQ